MTLHDVEDLGRPGVVLAYRCHTCGSAVAVEFPTALQHAAVRFWLDQHPTLLARARAGPCSGAQDVLGDDRPGPPRR